MLHYGTGENISFQMGGPFAGSGTPSKIDYITLLVANWKGAESPYTQDVEVEKASVNSKVGFQIDVNQLENRTAFQAKNVGGKITVYAYGDKPTVDYTFQVTIEEVIA